MLWLSFLIAPFFASASADMDTQEASGTSPASVENSVFSTAGPEDGVLRWCAGTQLDILPVRLVESEQRNVPEITAALRYGLPHRFSADFKFGGIYVKNHADVGAAWWRPLTLWGVTADVGLTYHFGLRFGFLHASGFDTNSWGWVHRPGGRLTFPGRNTSFTLSLELLYALTEHITLGDIQLVDSPQSAFQGTQTTLTVESMTPGKHIVFYGAAVVWSPPYDQAWLTINYSGAKSFYPRFFAGYEF